MPKSGRLSPCVFIELHMNPECVCESNTLFDSHCVNYDHCDHVNYDHFDHNLYLTTITHTASALRDEKHVRALKPLEILHEAKYPQQVNKSVRRVKEGERRHARDAHPPPRCVGVGFLGQVSRRA